MEVPDFVKAGNNLFLLDALEEARGMVTAADDRAANAQQMVHNRDVTIAGLASALTALQQTQAQLSVLTNSYAQALQASVDDRALLHTTDTTLAGRATALEGRAGTVEPKVSALQTTVASLQGSLATVQAAVSALQASLAAYPVWSSGQTTLSASLTAGAVTSVNVSLSPEMPSADFVPFTQLYGGSGVLGQALLQGVVSQTKATVVVQVKNTSLLGLPTDSLTVKVRALKL